MGNTWAKVREVFPPKALFEPDRDIPDLSDKVIIVTGGMLIFFGAREPTAYYAALT